jgi:Ca2+-binding EF-hand superfamily protein
MERDREIAEIFQKFDFDRSGTLSIDEMGALFRHNGIDISDT